MRFPSRPVLAASVLAALATSGGTVLTMPDYPADAAEAGSPPVQQAAPAADAVPAPGESAPAPQVAGPPVTGAQIAGLAVVPARDRANALAEQAAAEAAAAARAAEEERARREAEERANEDDDDDDEARPQRPSQAEQWEKFRRELREACKEGRVRGQVCRGA